MKRLVLFFLFLSQIHCISFAQKPSRPEKIWAITHPFVAKKAYRITKIVQMDVDSIKKAGTLGSDMNGGKLDAFKHAYWMASLYISIGKKKALKLGKAHEKGNYLEFKKRKLEDSILPDLVSSTMDLNNNEAGIYALGNCRTYRTRHDLQSRIIAALNAGKLFMIKKDAAGNYLNCDDTPIDMEIWKGKWENPKCLIPSQ